MLALTIAVVRPWKLFEKTMISAAIGGDTFDAIAPAARKFDRGFDRLGSGVHRQRTFKAADLGELFQKAPQAIVAQGSRGQRDLRRLIDQGREDAGVAMPLVDRGIRADTVEIAPAVDVVEPDALGAVDDQIQRRVVVRAVGLVEFDESLGRTRLAGHNSERLRLRA